MKANTPNPSLDPVKEIPRVKRINNNSFAALLRMRSAAPIRLRARKNPVAILV
jgi:hypothetical protein